MTPIHDQLTLLLEIQDIRSKVRELEAQGAVGEFEREHFGIEPQEAARTLRGKSDELVDQLDARVARRYARVADTLDRVVVPVVNGTCYGCYVSVASASAGEEAPNTTLQTCEHCGRFLYYPG